MSALWARTLVELVLKMLKFIKQMALLLPEKGERALLYFKPKNIIELMTKFKLTIKCTDIISC